jgi:hypothetical protein
LNPGCGGGGVAVAPVGPPPLVTAPLGPQAVAGIPPAPPILEPAPAVAAVAPVAVQLPAEPTGAIVADTVVPPGVVAPVQQGGTPPAILQILDARAAIMVISGRAIPPAGSRSVYTVVSAVLYEKRVLRASTGVSSIEPLPSPVTVILQQPVTANMTSQQILSFMNPYATGLSPADGAFEFSFSSDLITFGQGAEQVRTVASCYNAGCRLTLNVVEGRPGSPGSQRIFSTPPFVWTP